MILEGDIVVVDQGFRDAQVELLNNGYVVKAPCHQPEGIQLSTMEANRTRLVTKVRYEVERANGRIKDFKIFDKTWLSIDIPNLKTDFTVAAALHNRFKFKQEEDINKSISLAREMLNRVSVKNELAPIVTSKSFQSLLKDESYSIVEKVQNFPQLNLQDLENLAFGTYQIYQAKMYLIKYLDENEKKFTCFLFHQNIVQNRFLQSMLLSSHN